MAKHLLLDDTDRQRGTCDRGPQARAPAAFEHLVALTLCSLLGISLTMLYGEKSTPPRCCSGAGVARPPAASPFAERALSGPPLPRAEFLAELRMPPRAEFGRCGCNGESKRGEMALPSGVARTCTAWTATQTRDERERESVSRHSRELVMHAGSAGVPLRRTLPRLPGRALLAVPADEPLDELLAPPSRGHLEPAAELLQVAVRPVLPRLEEARVDRQVRRHLCDGGRGVRGHPK